MENERWTGWGNYQVEPPLKWLYSDVWKVIWRLLPIRLGRLKPRRLHFPNERKTTRPQPLVLDRGGDAVEAPAYVVIHDIAGVRSYSWYLFVISPAFVVLSIRDIEILVTVFPKLWSLALICPPRCNHESYRSRIPRRGKFFSGCH